MTRHHSSKKKKSKQPTATTAVSAAVPQIILSPEQKEEQELNELLQIYSPERREAMREKILQRNKKKKISPTC